MPQANHPYHQFGKDELILRDYLAIDRTILATQNTLLSHIRTALTLFVSGVSFIKFFDLMLVALVGWLFIPTGILVLLIGLRNYQNMSSQLQTLKQNALGNAEQNQTEHLRVSSVS